MNIEVHFTPHTVRPDHLAGKTAVVIDVLRATTSMIFALAAGAKSITPVDSVSKAFALAKKRNKDTVLCGERYGHIIKGFHMGNSPPEFTPGKVKGKELIMATTNGTRAAVKSVHAKNVYMAAFANIDSVAEKVATQKRDVVIMCSGKEGGFSLEDTVCAGMLIFLLEKRHICINTDDAARAALYMYNGFLLDIDSMIHTSDHGRYLQSVEHGDDLSVCARTNTHQIVPVFRKGAIVRK